MPNGIVFALLSYASFSFGDAVIKILGEGLTVFQIGFFTAIFSAISIAVAKPSNERWRDFWRMRHPGAVMIRAISGVLAGWCGIYAFTNLPLAEAYALIFLSPLFVTMLSILVLKEKIGIWRWSAVLAGFIGVLMVVRPGFRELTLAHFAALGVALFSAITIIILRTIAGDEKRTSLLGVTMGLSLLCNAIAVAPGLTMPSLWQWAFLALAGALSAAGHMALIAATRRSSAGQLAPTQYSQMAWAVLLGALLFREFPDALTIGGLVVIAAAGLLTLVREETRGRWRQRILVTRNRL